jgi:hypothetical protein
MEVSMSPEMALASSATESTTRAGHMILATGTPIKQSKRDSGDLQQVLVLVDALDRIVHNGR